MEKIKKILHSAICKYGSSIACFAIMVTVVAANSSCSIPFYEEEEPQGLEKFKIFNH